MKLNRYLASLALLCLIGISSALAAVTPNSIVTPQTPTRAIAQFLQGTDSAGTYKTIYTAGTNGSRCNALWLTGNDPSASHLVTVQIVNGGVKYGGMAITVGTTTPGFANGVPAVNLLAPANWTGLPVDSDGNPYLQMVTGDTLQATFATALTSTDLINIVGSCSDF